MSRRKVLFSIIDDQVMMITRAPGGSGKTTVIELVGGEEVTLAAVWNAVDQLLEIFPETPWNFESDAAMRSDQIVAFLLPYRIS